MHGNIKIIFGLTPGETASSYNLRGNKRSYLKCVNSLFTNLDKSL